MAKAGLLFVGTDDGIVLFSNPGAVGRWLRIGHALRGQVVRAVWALTDNPQIAFAAVVGAGVQRSDDGGQGWRPVLDLDAHTIVAHPAAPHRLYAGGTGGQVYRSEDAGEQWTLCPLGERAAEGAVAHLAITPADPQRLYLTAADPAVWSSPDSGASWARYSATLPAAPAGLAADPAHPEGLFLVVGTSLLRGTDSTANWTRLEGAPPAGSGALAVLAGKDPVLLLGIAGGVARGTDDGATWTIAGPEDGWGGDITTIAPATYHIDTAFAGSAAGVLALSTDRGRTWQTLKRDLPAIRSIASARLA